MCSSDLHALTILHLLYDQSLPIPSIPFSLQQGFTHSWMGETWMVDGEALVMIMATISSNSLSQQGARTEFLTPERGFAMAAEFRKGFVKYGDPPDVLGQRGYVVGRGSRGGARGHHTMCSRGHGPTARPGGVAPLAPLRLVFWLRESSGKIGTLPLFPEFFLKVDFRHKNETSG